MNQKEKEETKKIEPINLVYIGVLILFFAIITVVFFYSINFIVKNINKIFTPNNEKSVQALDLSKYTLIEKKLSLPINTPKEKTENIMTETGPVSQSEELQSEESLIIEEVSAPEIDRGSVLINILNGARKAGVAGAMSKNIEDAGFTNTTTGDSKIIYPLTTIFIKEGATDFKSSIEEIVKKSYPKTTIKTNLESSKFDIVIIIGKQ